MISYNFRYRGPFEYEKFVLNILQFHNEMVMFRKRLLSKNENSKELLNAKEDLDNLFHETMSNSPSEELYYMLLTIEQGGVTNVYT